MTPKVKKRKRLIGTDLRDRHFTRDDYHEYSRMLDAAAALMDGRSSNARMYRKLAAMLVFADVHMPKGLSR